MKFLLDESVETRIAVFLTEQGHEATRIGRDYPPSLSDQEVLALARHEQRILITNDKDFGELVFRGQLPHVGVILLRFPLDTTAQAKIRALEEFLTSPPAPLTSFSVLTPQGRRLR
jgi:predicted nuclease of predicted toxin-antitoxin system